MKRNPLKTSFTRESKHFVSLQKQVGTVPEQKATTTNNNNNKILAQHSKSLESSQNVGSMPRL